MSRNCEHAENRPTAFLDTNASEAAAGISEASEYREVLTRMVSRHDKLEEDGRRPVYVKEKATIKDMIEHSWRRYWDAPSTLRRKSEGSNPLKLSAQVDNVMFPQNGR
jgi:hypothetical protein